MTTREQKIEAIYEKIANKELSFGCKIQINNYWEESWKETRSPRLWRVGQSHKCIDDRIPRHYWIFYSDTWTYAVTEFENHIFNERQGKNNTWELKYTIIWHPVMIWDVLDYVDNFLNVCVLKYSEDLEVIRDIFKHYKYKSKPIEEQSDECINFIHSLLKDD